MAITDESRYHLHQRLESVLGHEEAATLMEHLPPVGWADVATKRDLDHLERSIRQELTIGLGGLRQELLAEIGGLRQELTGEIGTLRQESIVGLADLRGDLRAEIQAVANRLLLQLLSAMAAFITVVLVVSRIG